MKKLDIEPKNIIVRMPNWIGDFIMATPILAELRKKFPKAKITAMCRQKMCCLLEKDKNIDEIFCFQKENSFFSRRKEKKDIVKKLQAGKYDVGILLTNSFSSAGWFLLGGVKKRVGFRTECRHLLLNMGVTLFKKQKQQHQVETYKSLLLPLGIGVSSFSSPPRLYVEEKEIQKAKQLLYQRGYKEGAYLIGINPGAAYGTAKCWLPERFKEVARRLIKEKNLFVVFFGDQKTSSLVKRICRDLPFQVINLAGLTTLRELMCVMHECNVVLTNDSGPMHMSDALNVPVVAIFGSTSETITGPYQSGIVINKHVSCSPCFKRTCSRDFSCMKSIEVDEVIDKIKEQFYAKKNC